MAKLSKSTQKWLSVAATVLVVIAAVAIIILLGNLAFGGREEHYTATTPDVEIKVLDCESASPSDPFFTSDLALSADHDIKVTYMGDTVRRFFYTYEGDFASTDAANQGEAKLHADYNTYMGAAADSLSPTFSIIDDGTELKVTLVTEADLLNSATAKLFYFTPEEYSSLGSTINIQDLANIYQSKGFHCDFDD